MLHYESNDENVDQERMEKDTIVRFLNDNLNTEIVLFLGSAEVETADGFDDFTKSENMQCQQALQSRRNDELNEDLEIEIVLRSNVGDTERVLDADAEVQIADVLEPVNHFDKSKTNNESDEYESSPPRNETTSTVLEVESLTSVEECRDSGISRPQLLINLRNPSSNFIAKPRFRQFLDEPKPNQFLAYLSTRNPLFSSISRPSFKTHFPEW
jgi:hypothetical protein